VDTSVGATGVDRAVLAVITADGLSPLTDALLTALAVEARLQIAGAPIDQRGDLTATGARGAADGFAGAGDDPDALRVAGTRRVCQGPRRGFGHRVLGGPLIGHVGDGRPVSGRHLRDGPPDRGVIRGSAGRGDDAEEDPEQRISCCMLNKALVRAMSGDTWEGSQPLHPIR